jgi:hypothetical protein
MKLSRYEIVVTRFDLHLEGEHNPSRFSIKRLEDGYSVRMFGYLMLICDTKPSNNAWKEKSDEFHRRLEEGYRGS